MSAPDIMGKVNDVVTLLRNNGIAASVDPRDLNPPCAWVSARSLPTSRLVMCGDRPIQIDVYLIAIDNGVEEALKSLTAMLDSALSVLQPTGEVSLSEAITLPSGGGPLPAFRFTLETA